VKEAELCSLFIEAAREDGWTAYPEVGEWDIMLVWEGDPIDSIEESNSSYRGKAIWTLETGDQMGVEAKVRATTDAIMQAVGRNKHSDTGSGYNNNPVGPAYKAVLAPKVSPSYSQICRLLKLGSFDHRNYGSWKHRKWSRDMDRIKIRPARFSRLEYEKGLWLPPIVPTSVVAGSPSPRPLTHWRAQALRLCAHLREHGEVTSKDFKEFNIDINRWRNQGVRSWLVDTGRRDGRSYIYEMADPLPRGFPDVGWEDERDRIVEQDKLLAELPPKEG